MKQKIQKKSLFLFGRKSIFWKWMLSYIVIVIILLGCNTLVYRHGNKELTKSQEEIRAKTVQQIIRNLDSAISTMNIIADSVLVEESLIALSHQSTWTTTNVSYNKYDLCRLLGQYKRINGEYSELILYFENSDYVVTSDTANKVDYYYRIYADQLGSISRSDFDDLLTGNYDVLTIKKSESSNTLFFIRTIQENKWDRAKINLIFVYDQNNIENIFQVNDSSENHFLLRKEDSIVWDNNALQMEDCDRQLLQQAITEKQKQILLPSYGKMIYLKYYQTSKYSLVVYWTNSPVYESNQYFQRTFILLMSAAVLLSGALMAYFLNKNYSQISYLLNILQIQSSEGILVNELTAIGGKLIQIQENLKNADQKLAKQNNIFLQEYLNALIKGEYRKERADLMEETYGIHWQGKMYCLLLLYAEETESLNLETVHFILNNIYQEVLREHRCIVYNLIKDNCLILIINFPEEKTAELCKMIRESVQKSRNFIEEYLNIVYEVSSSDIHEGRDSLADCYQEAIQVMENRHIYGTENCLLYSDLNRKQDLQYYYPSELERNFIHKVQEGDTAGASQIAELVWKHNLRNMDNSWEILQYLTIDIYCSVLKALENTEDCQRFIKSQKFKLQSLPVESRLLRQNLMDFIEKACTFLLTTNDRLYLNDETLCKKINAYLKQNVQDCNLTVASVAEYFDITPVELSKIYRNVTGCKMITAISQMRMQKAAELFLSENSSLKDVAEKAGFGSMRTFIRTCKLMYDMTPSQWREKILQEHGNTEA